MKLKKIFLIVISFILFISCSNLEENNNTNKLKVVGETLVSNKSGNKLDNLKEGLFGVIVDDYRKKHEQEFKLIKDKDISQEEKNVLAKALVTDFLRTHGYEGKLPEVMLTDSEHSFTQDGLNKETGEKRTDMEDIFKEVSFKIDNGFNCNSFSSSLLKEVGIKENLNSRRRIIGNYETFYLESKGDR